MKKLYLILVLVIAGIFAYGQDQTFHDFVVEDIDGNDYDLSQLKGKKVLVVNVASKCGLTPQYEDLEKLYRKYKAQDFVIIGFPANNFMKQEPGTNAEIKEFCTSKFDVTFPMMAKVSVKGDDIHPIYTWLTEKDKNGVTDSKIKWNFQKYMIDENGKLADFVEPKTKPFDEKIVSWIKN